MLGIIYIAGATISHIGASIREAFYNRKAKVDPETNCYRDYHGVLRDNDTYEKRIDFIDQNGDYILTDINRNIIRNISEERLQIIRKEKKNDPNRDELRETVICTRKQHLVKVYNPHRKEMEYVKGTVFRDIDNNANYFRVSIPVPEDYCKKRKDKYFYVSTDNPFDLLRMSDEQVEIELINKQNHKYNWIDSMVDHDRFIKDYNGWPYVMDETHDLGHTKRSFIGFV